MIGTLFLLLLIGFLVLSIAVGGSGSESGSSFV
jgi:hypothetical protein